MQKSALGAAERVGVSFVPLPREHPWHYFIPIERQRGISLGCDTAVPSTDSRPSRHSREAAEFAWRAREISPFAHRSPHAERIVKLDSCAG